MWLFFKLLVSFATFNVVKVVQMKTRWHSVECMPSPKKTQNNTTQSGHSDKHTEIHTAF